MIGIKAAKNTKTEDVHRIKTDKPVEMLDKAAQRYYDLTSIVNNEWHFAPEYIWKPS